MRYVEKQFPLKGLARFIPKRSMKSLWINKAFGLISIKSDSEARNGKSPDAYPSNQSLNRAAFSRLMRISWKGSGKSSNFNFPLKYV